MPSVTIVSNLEDKSAPNNTNLTSDLCLSVLLVYAASVARFVNVT